MKTSGLSVPWSPPPAGSCGMLRLYVSRRRRCWLSGLPKKKIKKLIHNIAKQVIKFLHVMITPYVVQLNNLQVLIVLLDYQRHLVCCTPWLRRSRRSSGIQLDTTQSHLLLDDTPFLPAESWYATVSKQP
jgi:hypothetical protein